MGISYASSLLGGVFSQYPSPSTVKSHYLNLQCFLHVKNKKKMSSLDPYASQTNKKRRKKSLGKKVLFSGSERIELSFSNGEGEEGGEEKG